MLDIYKASAGSGKTYRLTHDYIRLLLGKYDPDTGRWTLRRNPEKAHRHILAITFTNKATDEMTRRIIKELAILGGIWPGHDRPSDYLDDFVLLFDAPAERITGLSRRVLFDLLFDFGSYQVSTIDAFFQTVLRTFAREIEMPDDFDLELNDNFTLTIGTSEMFGALNFERPVDPVGRHQYDWLTEWLSRQMEQRMQEGDNLRLFVRTGEMFGKLVKTFGSLLDEDFRSRFKEMEEYYSDLNRVIAFDKAVSRLYAPQTGAVEAEAGRILQCGDATQYKAYLRNALTKVAEGRLLEGELSKTIVSASLDPTAGFSAKYVKSAARDEAFMSRTQTLCLDIIDIYARSKTYNLLRQSVNNLGLLGCLLLKIRQYCKDNNQILLSETNSLLHDIINDDDTPFVYERLGYYLDNFLIDEFQDTSAMQWDNLRPLLNESLSRGNKDLIIGDEKQCIYRFRNSDPALLGHRVSSDIAETFGDGTTTVTGTDISDNNNWRSSEEVVRFNNTLFHTIAALADEANGMAADNPLSVRFTFSTVIQRINQKRKATHGCVRVIDGTVAKDDPAIGSDDNDLYQAKATAAEIDRFIRAGYAPSDICILVRKNNEGAKLIENLGQIFRTPEWEHGAIPISSTQSLTLRDSDAVTAIIGNLRLSIAPRHTLRQKTDSEGNTEVVKSDNPAFGIQKLMQRTDYFQVQEDAAPDETYGAGLAVEVDPVRSRALARAVNAMRDPSGLSADDDRRRQDDEADYLNARAHMEGESDFFSIPLVIDRIIAQNVSHDLVRKETAYINVFRDVVNDYCQRGNHDIRLFLKWWDHVGVNTKLDIGAGDESVTVMTVHSSKGLEFPCVIVPYADWSTLPDAKQDNFNWYAVGAEDFAGIPAEIIPPLIPLKLCAELENFPPAAQRYREIVSQNIVDNLNLAYVAFTRAVDNLSVITDIKPKSAAISRYISDAIDAATADSITGSGLSDEAKSWLTPLSDYKQEGYLFEFGQLQPKTHKAKEKPKAGTEMEGPVYRASAFPVWTAHTDIDADHFDFANPRHHGIFMHRVLSHVRTKDDLPLALKRQAYRAHLTPGETETARLELDEAMADRRVDRWFDRFVRVVNERTILNRDMPRRPDRIVWTAEGHVDVIDYKFGEHKPHYCSQVARYMMLLRSAGIKNVRGYLWYPAEGDIYRVRDKKTAELLDE